MRERIIIVFIALAIGLLVTTLLFFLYQQTKITPQKVQNLGFDSQSPTDTPKNSVYLSIDSPSDNSISDRRTIEVKGKTNSSNTIIISTNQDDVVTTPTSDGKFSVTISIDAGVNKIITRAIAPNGDETDDSRVITFSTEDF